ncbi:MAG: ABC transporter permease subunit [Deltaproteobacteria bacterium]|nr:ABC transporter permease subunit [Deltaproteobacteria bacterium]
MGNVLAVFRRELASAFDSPLAYIVLPVYLSLVAVFTLWFQDIWSQGVVSLRALFSWSAIFFLLLVPALTMRLFAEERRTGSLELLLTLPISDTQVVLGKYLSALALIALALLLTLPYPLTLGTAGDLDWGPILGGYLGLVLLGAAFCAIGTAASATTANQVVAFLLSVLLCLVPFAMGFFLVQVPPAILPVVQYLSFDYHFDALARGVIDTRAVVFHGAVVAVALHVATFALRLRRLA